MAQFVLPRPYGKSMVQSIRETIGCGDTITFAGDAYTVTRRPGTRVVHPNLQQIPKRPTVKPEQVACRYCKAEPGAPCKKWKRGRRGKFLIDRDPHPDRKYDARLMTETARTLLHR